MQVQRLAIVQVSAMHCQGMVVEAGMIVVPQMRLDRHMNSQEWRDTDQLQLEGFTIIWHHVITDLVDGRDSSHAALFYVLTFMI